MEEENREGGERKRDDDLTKTKRSPEKTRTHPLYLPIPDALKHTPPLPSLPPPPSHSPPSRPRQPNPFSIYTTEPLIVTTFTAKASPTISSKPKLFNHTLCFRCFILSYFLYTSEFLVVFSSLGQDRNLLPF